MDAIFHRHAEAALKHADNGEASPSTLKRRAQDAPVDFRMTSENTLAATGRSPPAAYESAKLLGARLRAMRATERRRRTFGGAIEPAFQGDRPRDFRTRFPDTVYGQLIRPTLRGERAHVGSSCAMSFLGRDQAVGLFDDRSDLTPVDLVVAREIQEHSHPVRERSAGRCRRTEEAFRFNAHQLLLHARSSRAPQRDAPVTAMVVVDVAQRPRSPDAEKHSAP